MADGKTSFWPKDAAWWRRESNMILGTEFGSAGPAVMDWVSCEADAQRDASRVKTGILAASVGAFVGDTDVVKRIISRAVEIGALDDFQDLGHGKFTARVSGMSADRDRASGARRTAEWRARKTAGQTVTPPVSPDLPAALARSVTPGDGRVTVSDGRLRLSRSVTNGAPDTPSSTAIATLVDAPERDGLVSGGPVVTGDPDRLSRSVTVGDGASQKVTLKPNQLTTTTPPLPPASGGRARDREKAMEAYKLELAAFLAEHPCCENDASREDWARFVDERNLTGLLGHSHPHDNASDDVALIGIPADIRSMAAYRFQRFRLPDGRRLEFVACPHLGRTGASR